MFTSISREGFSRLQFTYITLHAGKQLIDFLAHLVNRIHCAAYISHHRWESQQHTSGALKVRSVPVLARQFASERIFPNKLQV